MVLLILVMLLKFSGTGGRSSSSTTTNSQWTNGNNGDISFITYDVGKVGIGLSDPDLSFIIDVSGDIQFSGNLKYSDGV